MKRFTLLATLVAGVMLIAACGGGDDGDSGSSASTSAPVATSTIAPDPTAPPLDTGLDPVTIALGESKFGSCSGCHGSDARGVTGLGKDLVESEFIDGLTAEELVAFIKTGRSSGDPANTTGIDMPAKGGNPALSDDDIAAIVAYIYSLQ